MAKIERLIPRAADAAPSRSPERQAIAEAIARDTALEAEISAADSALSKAQELQRDAWREVDALEQRLTESRESAPRRLADALLAGAAIEDDATAEIESALAKARGAVETCRTAVEMLTEHARTLKSRRGYSLFDRALGDVIRAEAMPALIMKHEKLRRDLAELNLVLDRLFKFSNFDPAAIRQIPNISTAAADRWTAALASLRIDPDAALPEIA